MQIKNFKLWTVSVFPTILFCILVSSCGRNQASDIISELRRFNKTAEMSMEKNQNKMKNLAAICIDSPDIINDLHEGFSSLSDPQLKERLLCFCWYLSHESKENPHIKENLVPLLIDSLSANEERVQLWAAASLVVVPDPSLEKTFIEMFNSDNVSMWRHGTRGLLKIPNESSQAALLKELKRIKLNEEFIEDVRKILKEKVSIISPQFRLQILNSLVIKS